MKEEILDTIHEMISYFVGTYNFIKPILLWASGIFSFIISLLFPDSTYTTTVLFILGLCFIDILTKWWSIAHNNGGFIQAFLNKKLTSHNFWLGLRKKMVSYFTVFILMGIATKFKLTAVASIINSMFYISMIFRELTSSLENLRDGGIKQTQKLLNFLQRKQFDRFHIFEDDSETTTTTTTTKYSK